MAKTKLRKIAKNLKNQPRLKKILANWLATDMYNHEKYNIEEIFMNGHRGFLAMDEKTLTDKFDVRFVEIEKKLIETKKEGNSGWHYEGQIKSLEKQLAEAQLVYDEIFEQVFL